MRSRVIPSLLIVAALFPTGFLVCAQAAVDFPQNNTVTFNPPTLPAADGTVQAGQPTLNQRGDGYEIVGFSYTVTANRVGAIDVVWSASRNFNLVPPSNLTLRIKGDATVSLSANNTAILTVNGSVNGISPADLSFMSDIINGPQNQPVISWDRVGAPITRDAGNDQSLQMDFGFNWLPDAVGDQITISARSEIRIIEAAPLGVPDPAAVQFSVRAAPNPAPGAVRFTVALPQGAHVQLEIYDLGGRIIRTLIDRALDAGSHTVDWASRDAGGRKVAAGLYLFRLTAGTRKERGKIALIN